MLQFVVNFVIASVIASASYFVRWLAPAIVFPLYLMIGPKIYQGDLKVHQVYWMRNLFYEASTIYVISETIIFQFYIGSWYGWFLGGFSSWVAAGMVAASYENYMFHRQLP